ncbi:trypsin-like peptidase domain-containing protein [Aquimarina sp. U1-2]|uniref:T9SS type A sorting domain-containing protein n=1 Tax=Aquimarina sp. U1-2 TaxID=2823141 RepID=UPI001AECA29B|nr:trypsin-like peptidase domain-containing protein [Aquimarina sp. U1-2]MBP2831596.1 trypsin-like peptidase domain-containing protein [Aquimarina sp. U1-2]
MIKYKFLVIVFFLVYAVHAQVTNKGVPKSWQLAYKKSSTPVVMKPFNLKQVQKEDAANDLDKSQPWRFGYEHKVNLGLNNSGDWDVLPDGSRIWRINIISKGAKTLNFVFNTYKIPRGATIYLYNNDRSDLLGAYTNIFNGPDEMVGTWLVEGENVWIEYHEPKAVKGQGKLNISKVVHGYRTFTTKEIEEKGLNDSGDCNVDVNCPIGDDYSELKDQLKKAVGLMLVNDSGFCTGTLINNTNNDKAPYFLTAKHCSGNESRWVFRFNWISVNTVCATTDSSISNGANNFYQTTNGARVLATNSKSDFELVEITGGLDERWDLEWAGWDNSDDTPNFAVGIHHPNGDIMKVCRENSTLTKLEEVLIGRIPDPVDSWEVQDWDIGVTEGGSSGSALFDTNGRIVGQLAGGGAACNGTNDNNLPDYYGRFAVSWDFGTTDSTRLSNWLDPSNTGKETLDMLSIEITGGGIPPVEEDEVLVFFKVSEALVEISNGANKILDYSVYDIAGREITSGRLLRNDKTIDLKDRASGMYFIYFTDTSNGSSFTKKVIINQRF